MSIFVVTLNTKERNEVIDALHRRIVALQAGRDAGDATPQQIVAELVVLRSALKSIQDDASRPL